MSSPIPRRLLPHKASYAAYAGTVNSVKTYATAVDLSFVRFEPAKQNAMTSLGEMKNDRYLLFIDAINSRPLGLVPKMLDKVVFSGATLSARKVTACYGDSAEVHHYEVNLV